MAAAEFSQAARRQGLRRIEVLPFEPMEGAGVDAGWRAAEDLSAQISRLGVVEVVEHSIISKLMAAQGRQDQAGLRKLGRILGVDGIIRGSCAVRDGRMALSASLVATGKGNALASIKMRALPTPLLSLEEPPDLRDAPAAAPAHARAAPVSAPKTPLLAVANPASEGPWQKKKLRQWRERRRTLMLLAAP